MSATAADEEVMPPLYILMYVTVHGVGRREAAEEEEFSQWPLFIDPREHEFLRRLLDLARVKTLMSW